MEAYSMDLRERVIAAVDAEDGTREQIAARFQVSSRVIRKWLAWRRGAGKGGRKRGRESLNRTPRRSDASAFKDSSGCRRPAVSPPATMTLPLTPSASRQYAPRVRPLLDSGATGHAGSCAVMGRARNDSRPLFRPPLRGPPLHRSVSEPMSRLFLLVSLLCLSACGSYFPPSPTTRPVSVTDLAGKWSYQPLGDNNVDVLLELLPDGTYVQTVTLPRGVLSSTGRWQINGSDIEFDAILSDFDDWSTAQVESWRIVDRDESPTGFAVLGGAVDPDQWVILRWVR